MNRQEFLSDIPERHLRLSLRNQIAVLACFDLFLDFFERCISRLVSFRLRLEASFVSVHIIANES